MAKQKRINALYNIDTDNMTYAEKKEFVILCGQYQGGRVTNSLVSLCKVLQSVTPKELL
jgi:hypothetical protein